MHLNEAQEIVAPYWNRSGISELLKKNKRLKTIHSYIKSQIPYLEDNPRGSGRITITRELELNFREFARICHKHLGPTH